MSIHFATNVLIGAWRNENEKTIDYLNKNIQMEPGKHQNWMKSTQKSYWFGARENWKMERKYKR